MSTPVINVRGLVKTFGRTRALDGLDLTVEKGEVHGFLGPNGAGKSTTIRALLGQIGVNAGTASVLDLDPWSDAVAIHRRMAYVPGDVSLWPNLTGGEVIDMLLRMRGASAGDRDALVERFDLDPSKKGRTYSKGNRQKVALVAALAGSPELLLLDEPTSGLDPLMEDTFRECVRERVADGCTVLLSSHILSEVEHLCDRVTIIKSGKTVETGSLAQLRHLSRIRVHAVTSSPVDLSGVPGGADLAATDTTVEGTVDGEALTALATALGRAGLVSLETRQPSLEELFRDVYAHGSFEGSPVEVAGAAGRHRSEPTS